MQAEPEVSDCKSFSSKSGFFAGVVMSGILVPLLACFVSFGVVKNLKTILKNTDNYNILNVKRNMFVTVN